MMKFVVQFLITHMSPSDLLTLGGMLQTAGKAAIEKQTAIANALADIRTGVHALTK